MTLTIALEQIQKPSWWFVPGCDQTTGDGAIGPRRMKRIETCLKATEAAGGRVDIHYLVEKTNYNETNIRTYMGYLVDIRKVVRHTSIRGGRLRVEWEAR